MTAALALDPQVNAGPAPEVPAQGPLRRCLVTGEERAKAALVRFVIGPDGAVVPDVEGRLPGRGLWTLARRDIVAAAVARRLFSRAAKRPVTAEADLPDRVAALLQRRCIEGLGLARRAGQAVAGFEQVRVWRDRGRCAALVMAADASPDGRRKLAGDLPVAAALSAEELGSAFGRDALTYVGLAPGEIAKRIMTDTARLAGFRPLAPDRTGAPDRSGASDANRSN
ncbi:MAG TPA: RNA-binding protein [Alphaproteobacteria bacterium]